MVAASNPLRAAQYIRMSTDQQRYSLSNQTAAIETYAASHGFEIVRTYADPGRSGLTFARRRELQKLLSDVLGGAPGFEAVLVYDISRWGRFQDTDESAHYEWLVRNAGIPIHYCAEAFENDGSLTSAIMKNLKRVMAGEYSRELSRKVWSAQVRQFELGYRMGGRTPYGLRRLLLDEQGRPKGLLQPGEAKNLRWEKVVLVQGPPDEMALIRRIYRLSVRDSLSDAQIAALLNHEGRPAVRGGPWTKFLVRKVLTSEIYMGTATFNCTSQKLGASARRNPREEWVRLPNALPPIISARRFAEAQRVRGHRRILRLSEEALLTPLRRLLEEKGRLSLPLIAAEPGMPNHASYRRRYGSLDAAYAKVGYVRPARKACPTPAVTVDRAAAFTTQVAGSLKRAGCRIGGDRERGLLVVDRACRIAAATCRLWSSVRERFWEVRTDRCGQVDFVIACLLSGDDLTALGYYLIPASRFPKCGAIRILEGGHRLERYRLEDLTTLADILRARRSGATSPRVRVRQSAPSAPRPRPEPPSPSP
nr:recombinase family protein [Sphingomonas sp. Y57]